MFRVAVFVSFSYSSVLSVNIGEWGSELNKLDHLPSLRSVKNASGSVLQPVPLSQQLISYGIVEQCKKLAGSLVMRLLSHPCEKYIGCHHGLSDE